MSHPHITKKAMDSIVTQIGELETLIDNLQMDGDMDVNENASGVILHLTTVLKHEVERISVEDK